MSLLGRFHNARKIAICSLVLVLGATTTVETALAKKPKRPKNSASADAAPSKFDDGARPITERIGIDFEWRPSSTPGIQVLSVSPFAAAQGDAVPLPAFQPWSAAGPASSCSMPACQLGRCLGAEAAPWGPASTQPRFADWIGAGPSARPLLVSDFQYFPVTPAAAFQSQPVAVPVTPSSLPIGEWGRSLASVKHELVVGPNSFRAKVELNTADVPFTVHLAADYSVNADGLVYGVLSDVNLVMAPNSGASEEAASLDDIAEIVMIRNQLIDQPFSFRWRTVGDALVIKDVRFAGSGLADDDDDGFAGIVRLYVAGSYDRSKTPTNLKP